MKKTILFLLILIVFQAISLQAQYYYSYIFDDVGNAFRQDGSPDGDRINFVSVATLPEKINYNAPIKINFSNNSDRLVTIERIALIGITPDGHKYEAFSNFFQPIYMAMTPDSSLIPVPAKSNVDITLPCISTVFDVRLKQFRKVKPKSNSSIDFKDILYRLRVYYTEEGVIYSSENRPKFIESTPFKIFKEIME